MGLNPYLLPTLLLATALFAGGYRLAGQTKRPTTAGLLLAVGVAASLPGLLIALYYLHLHDHWLLFYRFRALPGSEMTAAGCGFLGGVLARHGRGGRLLSTPGLAVLVAIGILLPQIKPLIFVMRADQFQDRWSGGACLQSMPYTCGPAALATLLRSYGIDATEWELARECYTYWGGTECWHMARALRRRGLRVSFRMRKPDEPWPAIPCIAGVRVQGIGHFVALLPATPEGNVVADPMLGMAMLRDREYDFTGFLMLAWPRR